MMKIRGRNVEVGLEYALRFLMYCLLTKICKSKTPQSRIYLLYWLLITTTPGLTDD